MSVVQLINDRYELLEVIASGGMATVWQARDTRLKRLVALKRPHPFPPGDDAAQRLGREARAAAALNHPNLITIYDFGTDDTGPFLVMELVNGPTLEDVAASLNVTELTGLGVDLANALAVIHAAGIVHRDVKPANIIMSERGPLLTDFGIALDPNATAEITEPGKVVATPSYAAPEVLRGEPPTSASDVYSLGVMIEELIQKTGATASADLEHAIGAALAPSPEDRPTAADLAASLGASAPTVAGFPTTGGTTMVLDATPTPPTGEGPADVERRRPIWVWVAVVLAVLAIGLFALGVALSGDQPQAAATDTTSPVEMVADTSSTSTTTSSTTTSTVATTTTEDSFEVQVSEARAGLETALLEPPRSDMSPRDVERIMSDVDKAIESAWKGDLDKAGEKFIDVAHDLNDRLDGDQRDQVLTSLFALADLFGIHIQPSDDDDDD